MRKPCSENRMAILNISSTFLVAGINFITVPIFTRMLNTDGYGLVNVYVAWVQICTIFVGLKAEGSIGSAQANLPPEEQEPYQFSVLMMTVAVFSGIMLLSAVFISPLSQALNMSKLLVVAMLIQSFGSFLIAFFNARFIFRRQPHKNFLVSVGLCIGTTLLSVALIALIFTGEDGYLGRVIGLAVPNILIGLSLLLVLACSRQRRFDIKYWKFCLLLTLPLIFHSLSQIVLSQTGKIVIQQSCGDSLTGIYSLAVVMVGFLGAIYSALNNAFVPFMYDDLAGKTSAAVKQRHFKNYFTSFTLGTCAFSMMAPEILKIMSTEAYWPAVDVLPFLIIGQYGVFLYSFPVNYEFYKMRTSSIAVGTVLAALLNLILSIALIPAMGMLGAALATMVSYLALFLFHFCIARYKLGDTNYSAKALCTGLVLVSAVAFLYYPLANLPFLRWIIGLFGLCLIGIRIWKTRTIF